MVRRNMMVGLLCGSLASAAVAQGQPGSEYGTGSNIRRAPPASVDGDDRAAAREAGRQFGLCVVERRAGTAARLIEMRVDDPAYGKLLNRFATDDCIAWGEMRLPYSILRGSIFEALYSRSNAAPITDFSAVPPIDYAAGYDRPLSKAASQAIALAQVGDCASRANPAAARALVASRPETPSERQAVAQLAKALPGCVPAGQQVTLSVSVVRSAVAEGLYRLTQAATPGGAS